MNNSDSEAAMIKNSLENTVRRGGRFGSWLAMFAVGMAALAVVTGCQTEPSQFTSPVPAVTNSLRPVIPEAVTAPAATNAAAFTLREGDILKITFPGSPNLNNVQQIRTDGKITLPLIGEVQAAGLTPDRFATEIDGFIRPATVVEGSYGGGAKFFLPGLCHRGSAPPGKNFIGSSYDRPGGHHGSGRI